MNPYRHLLCPVDFSDPSRKALDWSSRFSKEVGARLSVLHVVDTSLLSIGNLVAVPDLFSELRRRAEEDFTRWRQEGGLEHASFELAEGIPENVIVGAANEREVDLLVMGTHGLSGFQKLFLGSVTEKVLHRTRVPLLTFPPSAEKGPMRGTRGQILMAIDLGPESPSVIRHGLWLAEHFGARPVAVHVVPRPYVLLNEASLEPLGQQEVERMTESLTAARRKDLETMLPPSGGGPIEAIVTVGSPFEALRSLMGERPVDLVVMGAGGHGEAGIRWLGSTCHKMVRWASYPVMVVR